MADILKAILLGIVEGLTEFLPISSTGHLIVAQDMINFYDTSRMFTVVIQLGAIAAVAWFYRRNLIDITKGLFTDDSSSRKFWLIWIIATIPAGIFGLLFNSLLEDYATTTTVAISLIIGGVLIWLIESYYKSPKPSKQAKLEDITLSQAIKIGFYQVLALIPGVSRSGATIMGGLLSGLDRVTATAFSFYLGIPILFLAGIYKLATDSMTSIQGGMVTLLVGMATSFITALFVVGWLLRYVSRHNFKVFAYYRVAFGLLLLVLVLTGILT